MGERVPPARAREVGDRLREIREAMGLTVSELADRLGWSSSKVSRVERGASDIDPAELVRYAAYCGAHIADIDFLLDWCKEIAPDGYYLSSRLRSLIFHESTASFSASYDPLVVPGLLQTQEYMTALMFQEGLKDNIVAVRSRIRMERQRLLGARAFEFYIHEQALRLPVGGNQVMNEQMLKLALLTEQPRITIRVIPTALGQRGVFGPPFVFFRFKGCFPLVYLDGVPAGLFVEDRGYVAGYHELLGRLSEVAMGRGQSREVLAALASEFDQPEDSPDVPNHMAEEQL